jgi:hypothetical protein
MSSWLRNALVYLGLAEPVPGADAEPPAHPMGLPRFVALAVALCLGVALALGVLWLTGLVDGHFVGFGLVAVLVVIARAAWDRREQRSPDRKTSD